GESSEGPEREGHLGLHGERRMAAGEDQLEPVVLDAAVVTVERVVARSQHRRLLVLPGADRLAAEAVDRPVARGDHEPRPGVGRDPIAWPALQRDRERLLGRLLGDVPVAGDADEARDDAAPLGPEGVVERGLDGGYMSQIGLTSTLPVRAPGILAAAWIAS